MRHVRIQSLDHLVLTVANVEATVAFYEKLGMWDPDGNLVELSHAAQ